VKEWLSLVSEPVIVVIDSLALLLIVAGTLEAFIKGLGVMLASASGHRSRDVWLRYARWLVAALTFQLAADLVESSITATWQAVARLAAIAVIRTFLDYFLERDLAEARELQRTRGSSDH
jgi:uncharacterized membrane protein